MQVQSLGQDDPLEEGILAGECHGQRSLAGCSPWGHKELDTTEVIQQQQHDRTEIQKIQQCGLLDPTSYRVTHNTTAQDTESGTLGGPKLYGIPHSTMHGTEQICSAKMTPSPI